MRSAYISFRCFAARFKFVSAVAGIFLSGVLLAMGTCAWFYGGVIQRLNGTHDREVAGLRMDLEGERVVNRQILADLTRQVKRTADQLAGTARTAQSAAETAKSAANTASSAAKNAAQANITVRDDPPRNSFPSRVEP